MTKKDKSLRICVDYRKLNCQSQADAYPMPRIDDLIDGLGRSHYISTLDLTKGYWQVPVAAEDRPKTAFVTPFGLFQFKVMPFGLQGAPATFQRLMDRVIAGLSDFTATYLDDVIIFSEMWEKHLEHVRTTLQRLRKAGLTVKAKKSQFGAKYCTYLGHIVGGGVVQPGSTKVQAVREFPAPVTKKQVRTFLGETTITLILFERKHNMARGISKRTLATLVIRVINSLHPTFGHIIWSNPLVFPSTYGGQRRSDITCTFTNYDLLMTFQAKLLFIFADSAVAYTVLLLVSILAAL